MSHSSDLSPAPSRRSRNFSFSLNHAVHSGATTTTAAAKGMSDSFGDNMALASDTLFDKFFPWHGQENDASLANLNNNELFNELDINESTLDDILNIKVEEQDDYSTMDTLDAMDDVKVDTNIFDSFLAADINDGSVDNIKSDLMWSSTTTLDSGQGRFKRTRDVSLTLSECADGILALKDFDVDMFGKLGATNVMNEAGDDADMMSEDGSESSTTSGSSTTSSEDEEIDVEEIDTESSARTRHAVRKQSHKNVPPAAVRIEAGRSLLKKSQVLTDKHRAILDNAYNDHCYFLARPAAAPNAATNPVRGMLTPNESGDEELETASPTIHTVDKCKIAQAVRSLIDNDNTMAAAAKTGNVKFKFRMKFKSTTASSRVHASSKAADRPVGRERRKSASKNAFCPPQSSSARAAHKAPQSLLATSAKPAKRLKRASGEEDKCREIRDLHNSMERQRRVELRHNFDQLKDLVPELAESDKASKLTILKKAMDHCHCLTGLESRSRRDKERELARNAMLRRKLVEAQSRLEKAAAGVRTSSGRVSGWHRARFI